MMKNQSPATSTPSYFGFLVSAYCMLNVVGNWFDLTNIKMFNTIMPAGLCIHLFTIILIYAITETYGEKLAKKLIGLGLLVSVLFFCYSQLISYAPSPNYPTKNSLLNTLFTVSPQKVLAIQMAYVLAHLLAVLLTLKSRQFALKTKSGMHSFIAVLCSMSCYILVFSCIDDEMQALKILPIIPLMVLVSLPITSYLTKILSSSKNANFNALVKTGNQGGINKKYLWIFILAYAFAVLLGNWFDSRQIRIFGLCTGGGSIAFPFTFLISDVITEVYGYRHARRVIWGSLLLYLLALLYGKFVISFISSDDLHTQALSLLFRVNSHILIASCAVYLIAETMNALLVAKLKRLFDGKYLGVRFFISTLTAYCLEELMYAPIAFFGVLSTNNLLLHMLHSWIFMVSIELIFLPVSVRLANIMKRIEKSSAETSSQPTFKQKLQASS